MFLTQSVSRLRAALRLRLRRLQVNLGLWQLARQVALHTPRWAGSASAAPAPVVFFNASTRLVGLSQNAAFSLLAANGLQLAGVPVLHFACHAGMSRCVLGAAYHGVQASPPCRACIAQSRWVYANAPVVPFTYQPDPVLRAALQGLSLPELAAFHWRGEIPLGPLVLPSLRWVLRRHHLEDDAPTRSLAIEAILSADNVAREFERLVDRIVPQAVVVFNGQFFPEAVARWLATRRGLRVISHEVGFQRFSAFFTAGEATAYPIDLPPDFELTASQDARLDAYLEQRFQGQFSMAGVRFWPEMKGLDAAFLEKAARFRQVVPIFTNVIFDTSQPHSNVLFPHMFAWLEEVLALIRQHPETLFVIRAHPDELRSGKASQETVAAWVAQQGALAWPNVVFINSDQYLSSYELIQRSKFVMVYNSSIGLEATLLGAVVLCAGKARYTQLPIVHFPPTVEAYRQAAQAYLAADGSLSAPEEFRRNARRFLYFQLFRTALPFSDFLEEDGIWPGFVRLRRFHWQRLTPRNSPAIRAILAGIVERQPFIIE